MTKPRQNNITYPLIRRVRALLPGMASLMLATLTPGLAQAQDVTAAWNQNSGGNWSDGANWTGGIAATGVTGVAYFTNPITAARTVTNNASPWTINSLVISNSSATLLWTIAGGTLNFAGTTPTITINGSPLTAQSPLSSILAGSNGLTKAGSGNLFLAPGTPELFTGGLNVNGGQLTVPYPSAAANFIPSGNALTLNSGGLSLLGTSTGTGQSQTFSGTTLNAGHSVIHVNIGSLTFTETLGSFTRNAGSTLNIALTHTGTKRVSSTSWTSGQIIRDSGVAYATLYTGSSTATPPAGGDNWAQFNGTTAVAATYTANTATSLSGNANMTAQDTTLSADASITSLRFADAQPRTITLNPGVTLTTGGILVPSTVGNNLSTITGGTLRSAATVANKDLVVINNDVSSSLTIGSVVADALAGATGLTKSGAGALALTGTSTYTGPTVINAGTVTVGDSGQLGGGTYAANITNNGALIFSSTAAQTLSGIISGTGTLTQQGSGTLTLSGVNTCSGATTISGGTLALGSGGSIANSAALTVAGGATLDVTAVSFALGGSQTLSGSGTVNGNLSASSGSRIFPGGSGTVGTLSFNNNLTLAGGGAVTFDFNGASHDLLAISGALSASGTTILNLSTVGTIPAGTYQLITYSGPTITSGFALGTAPGNAALQYSAGSIDLVVTDSLKWTGASSGAWDASTPNWQWVSAGTPATFANGLALVFDDTLAANPAIILGLAATPAGVTFANESVSYAIGGSGSIGGVNGLAKSGAGLLTLSAANSYSGGTTLSGGTLEANNNSALGTGLVTMSGGVLSNSVGGILANSISLSSAGTVGVPVGNTLTLSGAIANTGGLIKVGAGTLALSGVNTYSGATTVSNGTLTLSGNRSANSGAIIVGTDANLATLNLQQGSFSLGGNSFIVSTGMAGAGTNAIVNHTGGDISFTGGNALLVGNVSIVTSEINNIGVYNLSGGSITSYNSGTRGVILGVNAGCTGIFNLSGKGNLDLSTATLQIGRRDSAANASSGIFQQTGGTATINNLTLGNALAATAGGNATLTLLGGTFTNKGFAALSGCVNDTATITIGGTADVTLPAFPTARGSGATATITFDGGMLRPYAASTAYLSGLDHAYLTANGAHFNVAAAKDITVPQVLEDAPAQIGVLSKAGDGTLTLSGYNTFSGATTISGGVLRVTGSLAGGAVTVQPGATLSGNGSVGGPVTVSSGGAITAGDGAGPGNLTLGSLTLGALAGDAQTVNLTLGSALLTVTGALTTHGTTTINLGNVDTVPGTYNLMTYSGPTITSGFALGSAPLGASLRYNPGSIDLVVESLKWTGATSASWDLTTTNWQSALAGAAAKYANGVPVLFDDTLTANPDVILNTAVAPAGVTFNNEATTYSLSGTGSIAGTNGLIKNGAGILLLANANTYAGDTKLLGNGFLILSNSSALGAGTLKLNSTRADSTETLFLMGGITVTNPVLMDSTTGREGITSTNGNNTLTGPIMITGATNSHLYFKNLGDPGTRFAISNSITGTNFPGSISLRGSPGARGLIAGQVTINSSFEINGSADWTISSTSNSWTQTLIQGADGSLIVGANDALATNARVTWDSATAGALDLAGYSQTVAGLECTGVPTYPSLGVGNSSTNSDSLLRIAGSGRTFAGILRDGIGAGTRKLSLEVLSGAQTLTGDNTYSGVTTVQSNSTLNIGNGGLTGSISNSAAIVNYGTVAFNRSDAWLVPHEITGPGNLTLSGAVIARPGNSSALGGGTIAVAGGQLGSCRVELTGGLTLTNVLTFSSRAYPSSFPPHYLNVSGNNVLNPPADLTLAIGGNVISLQSDSGRLTLTKGITTTASAARWLAVQGAGDGEVQGPLSPNMALFKGGTGAWTLSGSSPMGGPTVVSNGTLVLNGSLTSSANSVTIYGGTLAGTGVLAGPVTITPDGTLAPGSSMGTLTINNDLVLQGMAIMQVGRNGTVSAGNRVVGVNTLTYGGTLIVTNVGSTPLLVGDSVQLFAATNYAGAFANIVYPDGYTFTNSLDVDGRIWVTGAPTPPNLPPNFPPRGISRLADRSISLTVTGAVGTPYRLWATTNVALTPVANTWTMLSNGTVTASPFTIIDSQATNTPRRFYLFSTP